MQILTVKFTNYIPFTLFSNCLKAYWAKKITQYIVDYHFLWYQQTYTGIKKSYIKEAFNSQNVMITLAKPVTNHTHYHWK